MTLRSGRAYSDGMAVVVVLLLTTVTSSSFICKSIPALSATHRCSLVYSPKASFATSLNRSPIESISGAPTRQSSIPLSFHLGSCRSTSRATSHARGKSKLNLGAISSLMYNVDTIARESRELFSRKNELMALSTSPRFGRTHGRIFKATAQRLLRAASMLATASLLVFGSRTLPARASSHRVVLASSTKVDKVVHKYVHRHMFNDHVFNPFESAYREAVADSSPSSYYPAQLSQSVSEVLGSIKGTVSSSPGHTHQYETGSNDAEGRVIRFASKFVNSLQLKLGLPKMLSYMALVFVVGVIPFLILNTIGLMFSRAQRSMTDKMAADRYGHDYVDLDATEKVGDDDDNDEEQEEEDDDGDGDDNEDDNGDDDDDDYDDKDDD